MRRRTLLIVSVALAVALAAISALLYIPPTAFAGVERAYPLKAPMATPAKTIPMPTPAPTPTPELTRAVSEEGEVYGSRLVVKEGFVKLIVPDVEEAAAKIVEEVERMGGYLVREEGGMGSRVLTVRVPADRLDEFVEFLTTVGLLDSFSVSTEEVTETYIDLNARLNSSKALEQRLLALLSRAERVEDVLKVEEELRRVRAEIEKLEAELRSLKTRIAYSTVRIFLVGGRVSYNVALTVEVENVRERVPKLVDLLNRIGRVTRSEYSSRRGVISAEVPTDRLDEAEALIPGKVLDRRVSINPSSTGTSTIVVALVERTKAYSVEATVEVDDVDSAFRELLGLGVGRVERATAWKDGGLVVLSLSTENLTALEGLLPGRVVDRRVDMIDAEESRYVVRLKKEVNPVVKALEDGVEALKLIALFLLSSAVVVAPIGLVAYGGYLAYRKVRVKRRVAR